MFLNVSRNKTVSSASDLTYISRFPRLNSCFLYITPYSKNINILDFHTMPIVIYAMNYFLKWTKAVKMGR